MNRHEHEIQSEEYREFLNDPGWHRWQAKRLREEAAKHDREAELLIAQQSDDKGAKDGTHG